MATVLELAEHLGMSHKNANELIKKGVIEAKGRGKYDLDVAPNQYITHVREIAAGRAKVGDLDLQEERARLAKELSRICAAPSARLGHFPFEGDRAFPAQC
ncbi:hypothetical protein [Thalassobacter stenotrophicus]|uniref:Uncharacterized protein n=2 Tax=Thalassobacter stenotrophicus TaxID=266809 RepID=A0A0P1F0B1_9RHOB|nr:hypothetical protein [Thalassobacter stenotrophicus]CUH60953.1 hypothetical protein THS5294_02251 [Thalassobacter stenotrophicus]SHI53352.1 hypothetical protein SAMN02744035_00775 [Thalassobacter stenotrophicus DSM 16310]